MFSIQQSIEPSIAVIGSGIGGASFVHYFDQVFEDYKITVYEKSQRIGGRSHSIQIYNKTYEVGATFICDKNYNMMELIKIFDLEIEKRELNLGFWRKNEFKFRLSNSFFENIFNFIYNYGLSLFKLKYVVDQKFSQFEKIYKNQDFQNPQPFTSLQQFLNQTELYDYFLKTTEQLFIHDLEFDESFVRDVLDALISDYYNQNIQVNGFTGFVVSTGFNCEPFQIKNGIDQISKKILEKKSQKLQLKLSAQVQKIDFNEKSQKFQIYYNDQISEFDAIILATPLEISNITLGQNIQKNKIVNRPFQQVNRIYFTADINNDFFYEPDKNKLPKMIVSPDRIMDQISIISQECFECINNQYFPRDRSLYSVSANSTVKPSSFHYLFYGQTIIFNQTFYAYPKLDAGQEIPEIILDQRGLYYLNSIESLASAQELQTIAAKNIVNLIQTSIGNKWIKKSIKKQEL